MSDCCPDFNSCQHKNKQQCDRPAHCNYEKYIDAINGFTRNVGVYEPDTNSTHEVTVGTMQKKLCSIPGCACIAVNEVVFKLRRKPGDKPAVSTPVARLCAEHTQGNLWDRFYTPLGWSIICDALVGMGHPEPKQQYSQCVAQPVGTSAATRPKTKSGTGYTLN